MGIAVTRPEFGKYSVLKMQPNSRVGAIKPILAAEGHHRLRATDAVTRP